MLCKARNYLDIPNLKNLYSGIFSSHLRYGCQVWAQDINVHNKKIFKLQNRAIRIITYGNNNDQCDLLYAQLRILKLSDLVKLLNCTFVHSSIKHSSPVCFHNYFDLAHEICNINTRGRKNGCIQLNKSNSNYGLKSIKSKCIIHWNFFTNTFRQGLINFTATQLKDSLTSYFIISYY